MKRSTAGAATVLAAVLTAACSSSAISGPAAARTGTAAPASSSAPAGTSSIASSSAASANLPASTSTSSATAHPSTSARPRTTASASSGKAVIYGCDQQPLSQPKNFILLCGDGGAWLDKLAWSHWGAVTAAATGVLVEKTCDPNCAAGGTTSSKATVTLTGLKDGHYTSLRIVTPKGVSDYRLDSMGPVVAN